MPSGVEAGVGGHPHRRARSWGACRSGLAAAEQPPPGAPDDGCARAARQRHPARGAGRCCRCRRGHCRRRYRRVPPPLPGNSLSATPVAAVGTPLPLPLAAAVPRWHRAPAGPGGCAVRPGAGLPGAARRGFRRVPDGVRRPRPGAWPAADGRWRPAPWPPPPPPRCWRLFWIGSATMLGSTSKPGRTGLFDLALDQSLDIAQQAVFVHADQRDRLAFGAGAAGAADTVHIVLGHVRQVEVDNVGQLVDVDTARGDDQWPPAAAACRP